MTRAELEQYVKERIYPNNAQEITGEAMQDVLLQMLANTELKLISGENIKTYGGLPIIGSGDLLRPLPNEIWYTSTDNSTIELYDNSDFGAYIVSNTIENGRGVLKFDRPIERIGNYAFYYGETLKSITIPDGVTYIGNRSFYYCSSLESVTIPDSVTYIGGSVFAYCSKLKNITIPDGVTYIGGSVFYYCSSLESMTIPEGVTSIEASTFYNCNALKKVIIGKNLSTIKARAFYGCTSLTLISKNRNPPVVSNTNAISDIANVIVWDTSVGYYRSSTNWNILYGRIRGSEYIEYANNEIFIPFTLLEERVRIIEGFVGE